MFRYYECDNILNKCCDKYKKKCRKKPKKIKDHYKHYDYDHHYSHYKHKHHYNYYPYEDRDSYDGIFIILILIFISNLCNTEEECEPKCCNNIHQPQFINNVPYLNNNVPLYNNFNSYSIPYSDPYSNPFNNYGY